MCATGIAGKSTAFGVDERSISVASSALDMIETSLSSPETLWV